MPPNRNSIVDVVLIEAIEQAVKEAGQPASTAKKIKSWMETLASRELDAEENATHLDAVKSSLKLEDCE